MVIILNIDSKLTVGQFFVWYLYDGQLYPKFAFLSSNCGQATKGRNNKGLVCKTGRITCTVDAKLAVRVNPDYICLAYKHKF
jgi:hypothetical protein